MGRELAANSGGFFGPKKCSENLETYLDLDPILWKPIRMKPCSFQGRFHGIGIDEAASRPSKLWHHENVFTCPYGGLGSFLVCPNSDSKLWKYDKAGDFGTSLVGCVNPYAVNYLDTPNINPGIPSFSNKPSWWILSNRLWCFRVFGMISRIIDHVVFVLFSLDD